MPMYIIIITYLSCVLIIVKIPFNFKFQKPKKRLVFFVHVTQIQIMRFLFKISEMSFSSQKEENNPKYPKYYKKRVCICYVHNQRFTFQIL